jgi:hypothetical protein
MVLAPEVVTVGDPVVVPEYFEVGTDRITTPEPPAPGRPDLIGRLFTRQAELPSYRSHLTGALI